MALVSGPLAVALKDEALALKAAPTITQAGKAR